MFATLTSKGQITLPKEIRDGLGLDAGAILDFQLLEQMDAAVSKHLRDKYVPTPARRKSAGK